MENKDSFIQNLEIESKKIEDEEKKIKSIQERVKERKDFVNSWERNWKEKVEESQKRVAKGDLTIGDSIRDYTFIHNSFYSAGQFLNNLNSKTDALKNTLNKLSSTKRVWFNKTKYSEGKSFELLFIGDNPYSITPKDITINAASSLSIETEPVFSNKIFWTFFQENPMKKMIMEYEKFDTSHNVAVLCDVRTNTDSLEKILEENPIALAGLRKKLGLKIPSSLKKQVEQYVHNAALTALKILQKEFRTTGMKDKEVQKIELQSNYSQRETEMFAVRPVIPDPEPDPVLARIMSYDARTDRKWALKNLAQCIYDLDRTGLSDYNIPIEIQKRPGDKRVFNLAEYSNYIRNILEISCKKDKVKV